MSEKPTPEQLWTSVDELIVSRLVPDDPELDDALAASAAAGLPPINVAPNQGRMLGILALAIGARRILEIGTLGGYSTIGLARSLPAGGRLVTLEYSPLHAEVARANIARAGLADVVDVRIGAALNSLEQLVAEGAHPFDMVFIDADKDNYPEYFSWSMKLVRVGSLIVVDNVVRAGAILGASEGNPIDDGVRRLYEVMGAERRVRVTAIQTVGSKGHDGFAIGVVTDV